MLLRQLTRRSKQMLAFYMIMHNILYDKFESLFIQVVPSLSTSQEQRTKLGKVNVSHCV